MRRFESSGYIAVDMVTAPAPSRPGNHDSGVLPRRVKARLMVTMMVARFDGCASRRDPTPSVSPKFTSSCINRYEHPTDMTFQKSVPPQSSHDYWAHVNSPTTAATMMKPEPSAPPAEIPQVSVRAPIQHQDPGVANVPILAPEPLPPSHKGAGSWLWLTVKLIPYHILNCMFGIAAFCVVFPGVCVSAILVPLCCLGIPVYMLLLQIVRLLSVLDVALANSITRSQTGVHFRGQQDSSEGSIENELRLAPKLAKFSMRSTIAILYFCTVKFALAIISGVIVCLPFLPIVSQIVADYTSDTVNSYIAGYSAHKFNFGTNPFLYFLTCVGFFVGGIILMHVFGRVSRETTRRVCGKVIKPMSEDNTV